MNLVHGQDKCKRLQIHAAGIGNLHFSTPAAKNPTSNDGSVFQDHLKWDLGTKISGSMGVHQSGWRLAWLRGKAMVVAILFFIIGLDVGTAAASKTENRLNYGIGKIGLMNATGNLDDTDADYDPAFTGEVAYGHYLTDHLIIEGGFNFFSGIDDERTGSNDVVGGYDQENFLGVVSLKVTLKGEFTVGPMKFYGGGGIGAYYVQLASEIDSDRRREFDDEGDDTVLGAHLVTGCYYDITPRLFMGIEGMYRWTEEVQIQETERSIPIAYEGDLNGYHIVFTTGFRF